MKKQEIAKQGNKRLVGNFAPKARRQTTLLQKRGHSIEAKVKNENLQAMILKVIAAAGVITVAAVVPNALIGLSALGRPSPRKNNPTYSMNRAFQKLRATGAIVLEDNHHGKRVRITTKGKQKLLRMLYQTVQIPKPMIWDEQWRVVIYDIKESQKKTRRMLRATLLHVGFYRLQDSVWVHPYPCEELVALLKADFQVGKDILYMVVKHLENDKPVREYFGLR